MSVDGGYAAAPKGPRDLKNNALQIGYICNIITSCTSFHFDSTLTIILECIVIIYLSVEGFEFVFLWHYLSLFLSFIYISHRLISPEAFCQIAPVTKIHFSYHRALSLR